jgi:hypothetical protein
MLSQFIVHNYEQIIGRCRETGISRIVTAEIDHRLILDQLTDALRSGVSAGPCQRVATARFQYRMPHGLTVQHVLQDYCDVRNAVTTLAFDMGEPLTAAECVTLDGCVDDAVIHAITEFSQKSRALPSA